ncbi:hypothetical protein BT96DRAFT_973656 [Gymnopus androsaceus JB14]|uniref:Uncharacterized protein n=1 Tax=Gymnopus androsaceus JB14 TaxID=1447944 RepID=A0A6A4I3X7_9AGAR|nr:hypothetical protein BT96DRAFT_973656 [Gymnopus androsaceus JB14]
MTSRMSTRRQGTRTQVVPDSLIPKTQEEIRTNKKEKQAEKESTKAATDKKKRDSKKRVASYLDQQKQKDTPVQLPAVGPKSPPLLDDSLTENGPDTEIQAEIDAMINDADDLAMSSGPDSNVDMDDADFADNEDEDEEVKRLEEELKKAKKKKANKVSVRQDIETMRVDAPSAPVRKLTPKRPSSESEAKPPSTKRAKQTDIGGLKANWKPLVYGNKTSSTFTSLEVSTEIEFEEIAGGEFAQDAAKEVMEAERAGKSHKKEAHTSKEVVEVKLEPADVNVIANEERETGKPAQPPKPRATVKVGDLPFGLASDRNIWNGAVQSSLIEWSGSRAQQFSLGSDPEFRATLRNLWNEHLAILPHLLPNTTDAKGQTILRCDHPAINSQAQAQIRNYRSKVGQRGLQAVIGYLQANAKGAEAEKQLVVQLRHKDSFIYEKPGSTPASSTGAFRGALIMRTFAFYLTWALDAPTIGEKLPAGALALATTAVYRALDVCKNGIPASDQKTTPKTTRSGRNTLDSFNEEWAPSCQRFYDSIINMKDDKWDLIFAASEGYILDLPNAGAGPALKRIRAESAAQRGQGSLGGDVTARTEDEGETIILSE